MKERISTFLMMVVLFVGIVYCADAVVPKVAFIYMGDNGPFTKPALEFAKKTFDTKEWLLNNFCICSDWIVKSNP